MKLQPENFKPSSNQALKSEFLQIALKRATDVVRGNCDRVIGPDPYWDAHRDAAREIKKRSIQRLPDLLERFEAQVIKNGGKVAWARDGAEAVDYIVGLARAKGARLAAKGKSMATEEVDLNRALEEAGVQPIETDLGEYIVQLAGETPSHILVPAVHKRREDISQLFTDKLGTPRIDGIPELAAVARDQLRQKFLDADLGISGCNVAVAETGSIIIVENEGNQRMCNTLPRTHVALVGIEKIVATPEEAAAILRVLTRAASGQKLTSYLSVISGPRSTVDEAGPDEVHVVLLDNGRHRILADPVGRESLFCLRCSACLNVCPIYRKVGGHAYGSVYMGPIGAAITPYLEGLATTTDLPYASTLCGACADVCPVKIDIPRILLHHRARSTKRENAVPGHSRLGERTMMSLFAWMMSYRWVYALIGFLGALLARFFPRSRGKISWMPPPFGSWTDGRDFPMPALRSFGSRWKKIESSLLEPPAADTPKPPSTST